MFDVMEHAVTQVVQAKFVALKPLFDERTRRRWAAVEARAIGRGGIARVAEATGMSRTTIQEGIKELDRLPEDEPERLRSPGGGRKPLTAHDPDLLAALEKLVDPAARGDLSGPLRWTCSSAARLAQELRAGGHRVSERTVNRMLHDAGYSLQASRKTLEGDRRPDAQFRYINRRAKAFQRLGQPVVSVDARKKELAGKNDGGEWKREGRPEPVQVHDFQMLGKALPYGVLTNDAGWASVGVDTATFAVETLRRWWRIVGCHAYPGARRLLIAADGGGSNGSRNRLWIWELQKLADDTGLRISVCHFPPGTRKWSEIEHRMSCRVTHDWRDRPLTSHEVVVNLVGPTKSGLTLRPGPDENGSGQLVTDRQSLSLERDAFHGEWNYRISPK